MRLERKLYFATKRSRSKWTAFGQNERSTDVKLKGQKAESGWPSIKLDSPKDKTWTVKRDGTEHYIKDDGRPKRPKVDGRKLVAVQYTQSGHSKRLTRTVLKSKMNDQKSQNRLIKRLNVDVLKE